MIYLNLGCGKVYHPEWKNIDFVSFDKNLIRHNILRGLPFGNNSVDVVYHSHLLEHLPKSQSISFLKECYRVLKKDGIMRVVVPDLQPIVIEYNRLFNLVNDGSTELEGNLEWIRLELFDQLARNNYGGEMPRFIEKANPGLKEYIFGRIGSEMSEEQKKMNVFQYPVRTIIKKICEILCETFVFSIGGIQARKAFKTGLYRYSGEVHYQMFDSVSLTKALTEAGFEKIKKCSAFESSILDFVKYELDVEENKIRKPDSLFMEAVKL